MDTNPNTLLEFLNVTAEVLVPPSVPPEYDNVKLPDIAVAPLSESTVNLLVLNANVVPVKVNRLSPIVLDAVAIGNVPLVKLISVPVPPVDAVVPITLLVLLFALTSNQ